MSLEPFIYLALFLLVMLTTYVGRWLRGEMEEEAPGEIDFGVPSTAPKESGFRVPEAGHYPQTTKKKLTKAPLERSHISAKQKRRAKLRLGNQQDLRQGIVLMTILGPCRALERPNDSPYF